MPRRALTPALVRVFVALCLTVAPASVALIAADQDSPGAVTNRATYNGGDQVLLRVIFPASRPIQMHAQYLFTIQYAGDAKPVADKLILGATGGTSQGYRLLWKVPPDARAGRYEIAMSEQSSAGAAQRFPHICSFAVHRQVIQIVSVDATETSYTSGDAIGCSVRIQNLSAQPLKGLRLEFSERYWPWIIQQKEKVGSGIATMQDAITLRPHQTSQFVSSACAIAKNADQPAIKQYAAVVWDHDRKNVYAIAFTPLVFINPPGSIELRPYPAQYSYPSLKKVDTSAYRDFHPEPYGAEAIRFETNHTMFATGADAQLRITLANPTEEPWRQVSVRARLLSPEGKELATHTLLDRADLLPHGPMLKQEVSFALPKDAGGLYRAEVRVSAAGGQTLAANELELGVNPLPNSVVIFCAHEDDDGAQSGFIRALVENQVPLHVVYFTSGDAGSCDRYFQHSCGVADALDFGSIRMQEARAALGHLGVRPENIIFLGLPDGGSGKIWLEHLHSRDPYRAVLLASDHAPYAGMFRPNLPYARDAVVEATEEIIKQFQPAVVFTVHPPAEGHIDHIVNNYFVVKALQDLLRAGAISPDLELRVDRIFEPKEHPATPYHYEDRPFHVSGDAMALAQEAGWYYQSQGGNQSEGNLQTWAKLKRRDDYRKVLDWKEHEGWNEKE